MSIESHPSLFDDTSIAENADSTDTQDQEPRRGSFGVFIDPPTMPVERTYYADVPEHGEVSEAAQDQGWGATVDTSRSQDEASVELRPTSRPLELPGRGKGRDNPWNQPPTAAEIRAAKAGKTPEEIAKQKSINAAGAASVRAILENRQSGKKDR